MLTFGSLFAGIGGFDLGLERAGLRCIWQVEIDPFCQRVLVKHWPTIPKYGDIHDVGRHNLETPDLICGGFPCQPVSFAGKREAQGDPRWLWPQFARVVSELRPRYVLVENVPGLLHRGFGDVLVDLASFGYDAEWDCIPASAFGAPHKRDRVWVLAYTSQWCQKDFKKGTNSETLECSIARTSSGAKDGHSSKGIQEFYRVEQHSKKDVANAPCIFTPESWRTWTGRQRLSDGGLHMRDGADTDYWATEPDVGRMVDGISSPLDGDRNRLKSLGNAVVPQVAEWLGHQILALDSRLSSLEAIS